MEHPVHNSRRHLRRPLHDRQHILPSSGVPLKIPCSFPLAYQTSPRPRVTYGTPCTSSKGITEYKSPFLSRVVAEPAKFHSEFSICPRPSKRHPPARCCSRDTQYAVKGVAARVSILARGKPRNAISRERRSREFCIPLNKIPGAERSLASLRGPSSYHEKLSFLRPGRRRRGVGGRVTCTVSRERRERRGGKEGRY